MVTDHDQDINDVLAMLVEKSLAAHVQLDTCTTDHRVDHDWYWVIPIRLTGCGSIEHIINVIEAVWQSNKLCTYTRVNLASTKNTEMAYQLDMHSIALKNNRYMNTKKSPFNSNKQKG